MFNSCKEKTTKCWECANACGGCSWSKNFIPVKGWIAKPTKVYQSKGVWNDSFVVYECPEFKIDQIGSSQYVSTNELANWLGLKTREVRRMKIDDLEDLCLKNNLNIKAVYVKNYRRYILIKETSKKMYVPKELLMLFFHKTSGYTNF